MHSFLSMCASNQFLSLSLLCTALPASILWCLWLTFLTSPVLFRLAAFQIWTFLSAVTLPIIRCTLQGFWGPCKLFFAHITGSLILARTRVSFYISWSQEKQVVIHPPPSLVTHPSHFLSNVPEFHQHAMVVRNITPWWPSPLGSFWAFWTFWMKLVHGLHVGVYGWLIRCWAF